MNYLAQLLESEAKNILYASASNKGAKGAKGQENVKSGAALLAPQAAAHRQKCEGLLGLVVVSDELLKLWRAAEIETGCKLTPGGNRRTAPRPELFYPRPAYDPCAARDFANTAPGLSDDERAALLAFANEAEAEGVNERGDF